MVGGSQRFEGFLKAYIKHFAFKTVSAEQFRIFFCSYFESTPAIKQVDWQTWFHAPGRHTSQQLPVWWCCTMMLVFCCAGLQLLVQYQQECSSAAVLWSSLHKQLSVYWPHLRSAARMLILMQAFREPSVLQPCHPLHSIMTKALELLCALQACHQ